MRKRTKKLSLHRETLRNLQAGHLRRVAGGGETFEILTTCACTDTCDTNWSCGCSGTCSCGCGGSQEACTTGQTYEILSGCATNCG
jgi:hypothetical protein